jgi:hypothetical protein
MNRFVTRAFVAAVLSTAMGFALTNQPAVAAGDQIVQLDRTLTQAFEKGDNATVRKLLDPEFTWIDDHGVMWPRREALEAKLKPLVPAASDTKVLEHKYGNVVWIQVNQGKKWAEHFWVKRPQGWRLLHTSELNVHPRNFTPVRPDYVVPCINPCKYVPYIPLTANEKAALAGWQDQESSPTEWAKHIADNLDQRAAMTWTGPRPSKKEMLAARAKLEKEHPNEHRPYVGAAPFLWSRWWDLGTAVVQISIQPTYGDKAYWASRIFAPLNGTWMMMESYHNYIDASPVMTAVPISESHDPHAADSPHGGAGNSE